MLRTLLLQNCQVPREDSLELVAVLATAIGLALVVQDAAAVDQRVYGGVGDEFGGCGVVIIVGDAGEFAEAAEDDALVVGPAVLAVR